MHSVIRLWLILVEVLRFGWSCRQKARGFSWTILPIPPRDWVTWRLDTAYGEGRPRPPWRYILNDVCTFLLWCRRIRLLRKMAR